MTSRFTTVRYAAELRGVLASTSGDGSCRNTRLWTAAERVTACHTCYKMTGK